MFKTKPKAIEDLDIIAYHLTGSRVFGDHTKDSDTDIVILANDFTETIDKLTDMGYITCASAKYASYPSNVYICRNDDNINIIVCLNQIAYRGWEVATRFAVKHGVHKEDRPAVFEAIKEAVTYSHLNEGGQLFI